MVEEKMVMEVELIRQAFIFSVINYIITASGTKIFQVCEDSTCTQTMYQHQLFMNSPFRLLDLQNSK